MKRTLILNYIAASAIAAYRIVATGTDDDTVIQASEGSQGLIGVSTEVSTSEGGRADVVHNGASPVEYGASVNYGDPLTADAAGKAISAQPGDRIVGTAMCSGINNDVGLVLISTGATQPAPQSTGGDD